MAVAALVLGVCRLWAADVPPIAQADPQWDSLFQNTSGWIGADGDYSIALSTNKILWLFSDTLVGTVQDGKRVGARMIHNSIALQESANRPVFYYGKTADGQPDSFVHPAHGAAQGYFWVDHGINTPQGLYFFAVQVVTKDTKTPFGFKLVDGWLLHSTNTAMAPSEWRMAQAKVPFTKISTKGSLIFGGAVLGEGDYVYIFGGDSRQQMKRAGTPNALVMARAPMDRLEDFGQWRFFANGTWGKDSGKLTALFANVGSEFSMLRLANGNYVAIYSEGIGGRILLRTAPALAGPWSEPRLIYRCPEMEWSRKIFCYAAKAHPELPAGADEVLITYAANSWNFWDLFTDARLYWPRFVRLKLAPEHP